METERQMLTPIARDAARLLDQLRPKHPVITLTGPRQAGKTTLCRMAFRDLPYANLEEPDLRAFAAADPRAFLAPFPSGAVIDEFQRVPEIASYLQGIVDEPGFEGTFVLTGSRNLAVRDTVHQSLAGRTALVCLLPFAYSELPLRWGGGSIDSFMYQGFYPRLYDRDLHPTQALSDYVATYVERDLRQLALVRDLSLFQEFLGLCAGRIGQLLNLESLGNDTGISQSTAREWISLLEASYVAFRLPPFHANISRRLVKTPKLYFYDVGLAACLMGITDAAQLPTHPLRGMLYENLIVAEILKYFENRGIRPRLWFYRDSNGNEVDVIIPRGQQLIPVEIKAATTINSDFFKGLARFSAAVPNVTDPVLVHGGDAEGTQHGACVTNLAGLAPLLDRLFVPQRPG